MLQYFLNNVAIYNASNYGDSVLLAFLALGNINVEYTFLLAGYGLCAVPASHDMPLA